MPLNIFSSLPISRTVKCVTLGALLLLNPFLVYGGEERGGGGDGCVAEFKYLANKLNEKLSSDVTIQKAFGIELSKLNELSKTLIVGTNVKVVDSHTGLEVEAVNNGTNKVTLGPKWCQSKNHTQKMAVVIHEYLSLMRLEKSQEYKFSNKVFGRSDLNFSPTIDLNQINEIANIEIPKIEINSPVNTDLEAAIATLDFVPEVEPLSVMVEESTLGNRLAIEAYAGGMVKKWLRAAKLLGNLKLISNYLLVTESSSDRKMLKQVFAANYNSLIGEIGIIMPQTKKAIALCVSMACVDIISKAQIEITQLAQNLQNSFRFGKDSLFEANRKIIGAINDPLNRKIINAVYFGAKASLSLETELSKKAVLAFLKPLSILSQKPINLTDWHIVMILEAGKQDRKNLAAAPLPKDFFTVSLDDLNAYANVRKSSIINSLKFEDVLKYDTGYDENKRRVWMFACKGINVSWIVVGASEHECTSLSHEYNDQYKIATAVMGPGLQLSAGWGVVVVTSPVPIYAHEQKYYGTTGSATWVGGGAAGVFVGKYGAVATRLTLDVGFGGFAGLGYLEIDK